MPIHRDRDILRQTMTPTATSVDPQRHWKTALLALQILIGIAAMALLVWELGWPFTVAQADFSEKLTWVLVVLALISEAGLAWGDRRQSRWKRRLILGALAILALGRFGLERPIRDWLGEFLSPRSSALFALVAIQLTLVVPLAFRFLRLTKTAAVQSARPGTLFVGGFAFAILVGTLLLKTPQATTEGISWLDAFFTSTSAICVTGLIVVDTQHAFTQQGQFVILLLIQAGGLGIMTLTYFMSLLIGEGITLRDSARLGELFSEDNMSAVGKFVSRVVLLTFAIEGAGAFLIHFTWKEELAAMGVTGGFFHSLFHSISAFCNAGFSTFSNGLAEAPIKNHRTFQVVIMGLIVLGGLGFAVLSDLPRIASRALAGILRCLFPRSRKMTVFYLRQRIPLHTRLTLQTSFLLLVAGAVLFFFAEGWTLSGDRAWEAAFNSVTARTAGFNTSDFSAYGFATVVLLCFLMFIGGSPGGTAGGVKTTTFAVAVGELGRLIRGHSSLHLRDRRIPREIVDRCSATIVLSLLWVVLTIFVISWSNPLLDSVDVIFECFSAFGTVGLSRGITSSLDSTGKVVLILSMFAGRVGLLTLVLTLAGRRIPRRYELPDARLPLS